MRKEKTTLVLYIHGQGGTAEEAAHYRPLFPGCDVVGLAYQAATPWEATGEFPAAFARLSAGYDRVILIANSIGAYFSMGALPQEKLERAYFISPIVDMERLIGSMMAWAKVSEADLREQGTIETAFGETLSWDYLCYVRSHPLPWTVPTEILYGGQDHLTDRATITAFAQAHGAGLTVMETGEHWFHTEAQMAVLDEWIREKEAPELTIETGRPKDIDHWMDLVRRVRGSFPGLETEEALTEHRQTVLDFMARGEALCAKRGDGLVGVLLFSRAHDILCFLAVDPARRRQHIAEKLVRAMLPHMDPGRPITVTTHRAGVPEGVAARALYQSLGFVPGQMTVAFGSEVQEFVLEAWQTS